MKILVPVRRVPNPDVKVRLKSDGSGIDTEGVNFLVNPFDEYAIEEAVQLVEKGEGEVVLVTIGTAANEETLRAGLALGAAPNVVLSPYVQAAVEASMIPSINSLRSLGIVWIPGLMAGMILAGSDPVDSAIYQFVVIAMLYAAAGTTSIACALLVRTRAFSAAEQLTLRPLDS